MNKDEQKKIKDMRMKIFSLFFYISFKIKNWIYISNVSILGIAKQRKQNKIITIW